ncbi:DUF6801 domain-containing protein [Streptomyces noursei]|uniref:DUF6801 domain-containing protein n=1 Tax=Streptomyces noursei TaxID=1971 RepID=UPI0030F2B2B0
MSIRYGRPRMRIILAVATASAMASGLVGAIGAGTAAAQPLSHTFAYTCSSQLIGAQAFTAEIGSGIPDSVAVGAPSTPLAVNAVATVDASFTRWLAMAGMKTLGGTVDAGAHVAAPQDDFDLTVPFHMATTNVPASGSFKVTATAGATTRTFSHPGKGTITAGDLTLHLVASNATGSLVLKGDAPCTLNPGQSNVVASFDVTKPSSAPSATPSPSSGSAASANPRPTTGSVGVAVPKTSVPAGTTGPTTPSAITSGNPSPRASDTPSVTHPTHATPRSTEPTIVSRASADGLDTKDLILLAVAVLAACAAAFGLGARLKNHRRTGDDGGDQRYVDPKHGLLVEGVKDGKADAGRHRESSHAAVPQHRGGGGRATSHGSAGRKVTDGRNGLRARHVPHRSGRHGVGARTCGGADLDSQLQDLLQGEDVDVVTDEKPGTAYVRQVQ